MHATLCDYLADIAQNAIEAGAGGVVLSVETGDDMVRVRVTDNGKGMDAATLAAANDPFHSEPGKHDARRVGLGVPFLRQMVEATGGEMSVRSAPREGTQVEFAIPAGHWDAPPLGDLPGTVLGLMSFGGDYDLVLERQHGGSGYTVARSELEEALGGISDAASLGLALRFLQEQEAGLPGSGGE